MPELDDHQLLGEFTRGRSEAAFAELVRRYAGLVYSTAFRHCGNPHHAEEIAQAVFIILARKAATLSPRVVVSGWLYQAARLTAANFIKGELRRRRREQEAVMQSDPLESASPAWETIAPLLDEAMGALNETDRNAVLLRYFENRTSQEIGAALRMNEETARKRVNRALEKLRVFFVKRGVAVSGAALSGVISANSVQSVSTALVKTLSTVAAAKGATASTSTLTLCKGALKLMAWTKTKTAIVASVGILAAAGTTTLTLKEIGLHRSWRHPGFDSGELDRQPPQIAIFPSRFAGETFGFGSHGNTMGTGVSAKTIIGVAYGTGKARVTSAVELPATNFDYIANLPAGNNEALQREVRKTFGVVAEYKTHRTDALLLKIKAPGAAGLKPATDPASDAWENWGVEHYQGHVKPISHLAATLEWASGMPVVDATGLGNNYDLQLHWAQQSLGAPNIAAMNLALEEQLGLELVPTNLPLPMLVVDKAE